MLSRKVWPRLLLLLGLLLGFWLLDTLRQPPEPPPRRTASSSARARPGPKLPGATALPSARPPKLEDVPPLPEPEPFEPEAVDEEVGRIVVNVRDTNGRPAEARLRFLGCDVRSMVPLGPGQWEVEAGPGACVFGAVRQDGMLNVFGDEAEVDVVAGGEHRARLEVPAGRVGGIGVRFQPTSGGVEVVQVVQGTPAWEAGLRPGDLIVEVEGVQAGELGSEEFVRTTTGEEGSPVHLRVRSAGEDEREVELIRRYIDG